MVSPSAKAGNWPNSWRKVFTDTETPSLFQGVRDTKLAGESPGGLPLQACAYLKLKYLLLHPFVTDVHLPKQNNLFHLHSKQVRWGELEGQWREGNSTVQNGEELEALTNLLHECPVGTQGTGGCPQSCSTKDEKKVSASETSHIMCPSPTAPNSQQAQEEINEEVPQPSGSQRGRVSVNSAEERILVPDSPLAWPGKVLLMRENKKTQLAYDLKRVAYRSGVRSQHWQVVFSHTFLREHWAKPAPPLPITTHLWWWKILSFRDALWTLQLILVISQATKPDFYWSTLPSQPIWRALQLGSVRLPSIANIVPIKKSEPITIKLLSVIEIGIKIKEVIYSEDFKWHLAEIKKIVWKRVVRRWLRYYQ